MNIKTVVLISSDKKKARVIYHTYSLKGFEVIAAEEYATGLSILRDINYSVDLIVAEAFLPTGTLKEFETDMLKLGKKVPLLLWDKAPNSQTNRINEASNINFLTPPFRLNDLVVKTDSLLKQDTSTKKIGRPAASTYKWYSGLFLPCLRLLQIVPLWNFK